MNDTGVVLGRLGQQAFDSGPEALVEAAMESGPTMIRPNTPLTAALQWMRKWKRDSLVVTTSAG
jgi:hypothetical protein